MVTVLGIPYLVAKLSHIQALPDILFYIRKEQGTGEGEQSWCLVNFTQHTSDKLIWKSIRLFQGKTTLITAANAVYYKVVHR